MPNFVFSVKYIWAYKHNLMVHAGKWTYPVPWRNWFCLSKL